MDCSICSDPVAAEVSLPTGTYTLCACCTPSQTDPNGAERVARLVCASQTIARVGSWNAWTTNVKLVVDAPDFFLQSLGLPPTSEDLDLEERETQAAAIYETIHQNVERSLLDLQTTFAALLSL